MILKILFMSFLFMLHLCFAESSKLSSLPLPTMEMVNVDPTFCDEDCLNALLQEKMTFSFLARFPLDMKDNFLRSTFSSLMERHGFGLAYANRNSDAQVKIALLLPKKSIGGYSLSTINTVLSYLTSQRNSFYFEVFDLHDEKLQSLSSTLGTIENRGFGGAILIATTQAIPFIPKLNPKIPLFIASVHKEQITIDTDKLSPNIIFGGISYYEQIAALKRFSEPSASAVLYNDESATGFRIANDIKKQGFKIAWEQSFSAKSAATFGRNLKNQEQLIRGSNLFLNTPINNSAFILSQLTYSRVTPAAILMTQLGFNHALFALTQPKDRLFLYISSVSGENDSNIHEYGALLDVDLRYDWIHYATAIGTEHLYHLLFSDEQKWFKEEVHANQVEYKVKVYKAEENRFKILD